MHRQKSRDIQCAHTKRDFLDWAELSVDDYTQRLAYSPTDEWDAEGLRLSKAYLELARFDSADGESVARLCAQSRKHLRWSKGMFMHELCLMAMEQAGSPSRLPAQCGHCGLEKH